MKHSDNSAEELLSSMLEDFKGMKPSGRKLGEALNSMLESFIEANGYVPTEEELIRMTDEVREEIRREKEGKKPTDDPI